MAMVDSHKAAELVGSVGLGRGGASSPPCFRFGDVQILYIHIFFMQFGDLTDM